MGNPRLELDAHEIARLYRRGMTSRQLGDKYFCSHSHIITVIKAEGVTPRQPCHKRTISAEIKVIGVRCAKHQERWLMKMGTKKSKFIREAVDNKIRFGNYDHNLRYRNLGKQVTVRFATSVDHHMSSLAGPKADFIRAAIDEELNSQGVIVS